MSNKIILTTNLRSFRNELQVALDGGWVLLSETIHIIPQGQLVDCFCVLTKPKPPPAAPIPTAPKTISIHNQILTCLNQGSSHSNPLSAQTIALIVGDKWTAQGIRGVLSENWSFFERDGVKRRKLGAGRGEYYKYWV